MIVRNSEKYPGKAEGLLWKGATLFELELYETEDGKEPVAEFLDSLDPKMNAKLIGLMELLEEKEVKDYKAERL